MELIYYFIVFQSTSNATSTDVGSAATATADQPIQVDISFQYVSSVSSLQCLIDVISVTYS